MNQIKHRTIRPRRQARILAGRARFASQQAAANHCVSLYRRAKRIRRPIADRHLFVLAHPRSGSTVLAHVLDSHSQITGFGEHHVSYATPADLARLEARSAFFAKKPNLHTTYVLDKLVWNRYSIAPSILRADSSRFVILVRAPDETFDSYRRMFAEFPTDVDRFRSYRRRLEALVKQAELINDPTRTFSLTYQQLTDNTAEVLAAMTDLLGLKSPLTANYRLTSQTGSQSWGDPSSNIKAGRVLRLEHHEIQVDPQVKEPAERLYNETVKRLAAVTTTLLPPAQAPS